MTETATTSAIRNKALELGFDAVGFAKPSLGGKAREGLKRFLERGFHGDMGWMESKADRRADPKVLWPEVRTVIALGLNYTPPEDPLALLEHEDRGCISVYARGRDYHDVVKKRLKALARWMVETYGGEVKVFVDTAPVQEKPLGERAGIGWQGKHSNLVSREHGSWLFLGEIYTTLALETDEPEADHCGTCRQCLDICPTDAFPEPYVLDARRCISYLTIEHKGHIAEAFRAAIGNRIFGCDDCLAVCPWNKFAHVSQDGALRPRLELSAPRLADLATLDDAGFRRLFAGTPVKRLGRDRFLRNVLIALGNSGDAGQATAITPHLNDASPLVRAMAVWALACVLEPAAFEQARAAHLPGETDPNVGAEWDAGQAQTHR